MRSAFLRQFLLPLVVAGALGGMSGAQAQVAGNRGTGFAVEEVRKDLQGAAAGDEEARRRLAGMFGPQMPWPGDFYGEGRRDIELARDFYRHGAALGNPKAMYFLGNLYCSDFGEF